MLFQDQDAQIIEQCGDSSDDERFPVLGEWREEGFGNPVIQDIRCPEFEYRVNEAIQGAKYRTIEDVKDTVKVWAISLRKEFRVLKSNSKEYEVRCADRDCMLTFLSAPICIPQAHGSCSFSLRVFPQVLSIRGSTKNYLRFFI